jgi:hypothetical protein
MSNQKHPTDRLRVNVWRMLFSVIGFGLAAIYLSIAIAAQDPLWFLRGFSELPARIVVHDMGRQVELRPGQRNYAAMAEAIRASLAQGVTRGSGVGLSAGSVQDAYTLYLTVEAFWDQPVKLHAALNTGYATQMLFPITGRHADQPIVFLGKDGSYLSNGPILSTVQPIRDALTALGYASRDP